MCHKGINKNMNINNFERSIDSIILMRGLNYYTSGNILSLDYYDNKWNAEVAGSDDYYVTVALSETGDITFTECNCPYDWGEYCKHQVAVFYEIKNRLQSGEPTVQTKKKSLDDILDKLSKEVLKSIIIEYAQGNHLLKKELFMRYDEDIDVLSTARSIIKNAIYAVDRDRGYIHEDDSFNATKGADIVLSMVDDKIIQEDIETAIKLSIIVIEEMMALYEYCDDSFGCVGGNIEDAIEKISSAIKNIKKNDDTVFDIVFEHAMDKIYDDWIGWRIDVMTSLVPLCSNSVIRGKIELYISKQLSKDADKSKQIWYSERNDYLKLQSDIILQFDGESAAMEFMEQNLENDDFRTVLIESALHNKNFERAIELCLSGEQAVNKNKAFIKKLKNYRYTAYEKMNSLRDMKALSKELLLEGDFNYYQCLKSLHNENEWSSILFSLIDELEKNDRGGIYTKILIAENLKTKLLEYCQKNNYYITHYYSHLIPEHRYDVGVIFMEYIKTRAEQANARGAYRDVCKLILEYEKACGIEAHGIREELMETYTWRRAFLDELRKLKLKKFQ